MTVAEARDEYAAAEAAVAGEQERHARGLMLDPPESCRHCHWLALVLEGAQLAIDLAVSIESQQRLRDGVAWA
jgi:hypothetical protein